MEAWRYEGETVKKGLTDMLRKSWKKGVISDDWRLSIIVPLYKREDKEKTKSYRGIFLLNIAYKIYAEILRARLEKDMEKKRILPKSQAGFRKGRSTLDNIYILNHGIQREQKNNKGEDEVRAICGFEGSI